MSELTPPANLQDFILAEVHRQTSEEALRTRVQESIDKTIQEVVRRAMDTYGHVGKQISKAVEDALSIDGSLDIPSYSHMMMSLLRTKLDEHVSMFMADKLSADMEEILSIAPKEVRLSGIVEKLREQAKDDSDGEYGRFTFIAEESSGGYFHFYLDRQEEDRKYNCETQFMTDKEGKIRSLSFGQRDVKSVTRFGPYYGYQKMIFLAYASGSKLILDVWHPSTKFGDDY